MNVESLTQIADRHGLTKQWVGELMRRDGAPQPDVDHYYVKLYDPAKADEWIASARKFIRKPKTV